MSSSSSSELATAMDTVKAEIGALMAEVAKYKAELEKDSTTGDRKNLLETVIIPPYMNELTELRKKENLLLQQSASAAVAAHNNNVTLMSVVRKVIRSPEEKVVQRMRTFLKSDVTNILLMDDPELIKTCYMKAKALPSSETTAAMTLMGISITEQCASNDKAVVLYGFKDGSPVALKKLHDEEIEKLLALAAENIKHSSIIPFEFVERKFICMPQVVTTLVYLNPLNRASQILFWSSISSAVDYLHRKGFAHMDIKPENIGVMQCNHILLDLGSAAKFGEWAPVTEEFVPAELTVNRGLMRAASAVDWWTIASTLCFKLDPELHGRKNRLKQADIKRLLADKLASAVWMEFQHMLDPRYSIPAVPFVSSCSASVPQSI